MSALTSISNQQVASKTRVLADYHSEGLDSDDARPRVRVAGMASTCNLGTGDYNDLTTSDTVGCPTLDLDVHLWTRPATVYSPKQTGAGKIELQIDGQSQGTADSSATGARQPQQAVFAVTGLSAGTHSISIVNRGPGSVAVDAIVVH